MRIRIWWALRGFYWSSTAKRVDMSRKRTARLADKNTIIITRSGSTTFGLPPFVEIGHRHLEKESSAPVGVKEATFILPLDLLRMVMPDDMVAGIDSVELGYKRK
jgi:hypothetical protein